MRLLIVEDEDDLAHNLARGLRAEGFTVDIARDGHYGLQLALTGSYAAIVLDLMLPVLSGYTVCQQLRQAGVTTPILVLSAKDGDHDHADALDVGADDFLSKPFRYVILLAHLRALIRRGATLASDVLVLEQVEVDVRRRCATDRGRSIELTAGEFDLLTLLVGRAREVVSKDELLTELWDGDTADGNVVEARVSRLRRKLGADASVYITTVRGGGYRLDGTARQ